MGSRGADNSGSGGLAAMTVGELRKRAAADGVEKILIEAGRFLFLFPILHRPALSCCFPHCAAVLQRATGPAPEKTSQRSLWLRWRRLVGLLLYPSRSWQWTPNIRVSTQAICCRCL